MRPEECEAVASLVARTFHHDVAPGYPARGITEFLAYANAQGLHTRMAQAHTAWVAVAGEALVGMVEMREHRHVSLLFVDPAWQRRGVARALLSRVLQEARAARPLLAGVTVNAAPNAVGAYERLGFRPTGPLEERSGVVSRPMVLALSPLAS
jgi:GNAT superfamily N-acetyltransferase